MISQQGALVRKLRFLLAAGLSLCAACGQDGSHQIVPSDGSFDLAILASSGGLPRPKYTGDECDSSYLNAITVDHTAATVTWDTCAYDVNVGHSVIGQGTRSLTTDELTSVKDALLEVTVGNDGLCGMDKAIVTLDVQVHGETGRYVDDFYGCKPAPDGRTFVMKIDWVESAMGKLVD
jgi:hypothetical protein